MTTPAGYPENDCYIITCKKEPVYKLYSQISDSQLVAVCCEEHLMKHHKKRFMVKQFRDETTIWI